MANKSFSNVKVKVTHLDLSKDASRSVLVSGENISHSLGKIARWYKDIAWTGHTHTKSQITDFAHTHTSLDSSVDKGAENQPVYFVKGVPTAIAYTIKSSVPANAVFTDTDTKVTSVGNHYTPSGGTTTSASGGTLTDITNSANGVQVLTGVTKDAAGHVTGVTSIALKSVNSNTTYAAGTGISISTANVINHSNSITAVTTAAFKKFKYDAQGHITGTADVTAADLPSHTHSGYAASNHTHSYLPLSGGTMTGTISSNVNTGTYLNGNKGTNVIINSTSSAGSYTMLAKMNSTNGYFTHGTYQTRYELHYTAKSTVDAGTNGVTKNAILLDESGNASWPGTITASSFSGNATTATTLATARTINGVSFNGSANITVPRSIKHIHYAVGTNGTGGYVKICTVGTSGAYGDQPLRITLGQRKTSVYDIFIVFENSGAAKATIRDAYFRSNRLAKQTPQVHYCLNSDGYYDIYVTKSEAYDHIYIMDYIKSDGDEGNQVSLTWTDTLVSTLPSGSVAMLNEMAQYYNTGSRTANTVLAAPNGSAGTATFRALVAADLPASGATAGSYGPSANASPAHSGTFSVPYLTVDSYGRVTAISTKTITLPASGNTDAKVTQTISTANAEHRILMSATADDTTRTEGAIKDAGFRFNPSTNRLILQGNTVTNPVYGSECPAIRFVNASNAQGVELIYSDYDSYFAPASLTLSGLSSNGDINKVAFISPRFVLRDQKNTKTTADIYISATGTEATADAASTQGEAIIRVGNEIAAGLKGTTDGAGNSRGRLRIYGTGTYYVDIIPGTITANRSITLPNASGTVSLNGHTHTKSDITDFPTSLPASDVYSWAKAATKPTYTASEVGAAAASHTHSYLPLSGGTMTGTISSSVNTSTYLNSNKGTNVIINSTNTAGAYTMLAKMNSTNGYMTIGTYQTRFELHYTAKSTVDAGTNNVTKNVTLLDESGNASWPGTITASSFSGKATSAGNADYPTGFASRQTTATWGNQTGTVITDWRTTNSGDIAFRENNGQLNVVIDGFFYQNEGNNKVLDTGGGTLTGDLVFAEVTSTTYPATSKAIKFSGSTDGANIFYRVNASDQGELVIQTTDDSNCYVKIESSHASAKNTIKFDPYNSYIYANYFNAGCSAETPTTSSYIIYANSDGWLRKSTLANVKTILGIPSNAVYTDTNNAVTQSATTTTNYRPILSGATNVGTSGTGLDATITSQAYVSNMLFVQPSTGRLYARNLVAYNVDGGDVIVEWNRSVNASWRMVNTGGSLYLQCNYTTVKTDYYNAAKFNHNKGAVELYTGTLQIGNSDKASAGISFKTTNYTGAYLRVYDTGNAYNHDVVLHSTGSVIIGAGESANVIYTNNIESIKNSENMALGADGDIFIYTGANTINARKRFKLTQGGNFGFTGMTGDWKRYCFWDGATGGNESAALSPTSGLMRAGVWGYTSSIYTYFISSSDINEYYFTANTYGIFAGCGSTVGAGGGDASTLTKHAGVVGVHNGKDAYYACIAAPSSLSNHVTCTLPDIGGELMTYQTGYFAWDNSSTHTTKPWKRILYTKLTSAWLDHDCVFMLTYGFGGGSYITVICKAHIRSNGNKALDSYGLQILSINGATTTASWDCVNNLRICYTNVSDNGGVIGEVWLKNVNGQYAAWNVSILNSGKRDSTADHPTWNLVRNTNIGNGEGSASYTAGTGNKGPGFASFTHMKYANNYWGMADPALQDNVWIRTTSNGIIPYQSGAAGSGHGSLGTSSWYFANAYIDSMHGTADRAINSNNCKTTVTDPSSNTSYGIVFAVNPNTSEDNTLRKSNDFRFNHWRGAANTEGWSELILGNSTAKTAANNSTGRVSFYNGTGNWAHLNAGSYTSNVEIYLPSSGGTMTNVIYKTAKTATAVSNTGWTNNATDDNIVPTMSFMTYWNGRYNSSSSNLQYCNRGAFGTIVTAGVGDYVKISKVLWTGTVATTARGEKSYTLANKATGYNIIKILYTSSTMSGGAAGCLEINGTKTAIPQPVVVGASATSTMQFYFKISSDGATITVGSNNEVITITGIYGLII